MDPTLDSRGVLAKPAGDIVATMALADEQHSMKPVVVTRFIGATDLLLKGNSHGFGICNLKRFHRGTLRLPEAAYQVQNTALLMTLCIALGKGGSLGANRHERTLDQG
jgi:hypothetical protein